MVIHCKIFVQDSCMRDNQIIGFYIVCYSVLLAFDFNWTVLPYVREKKSEVLQKLLDIRY